MKPSTVNESVSRDGYNLTSQRPNNRWSVSFMSSWPVHGRFFPLQHKLFATTLI